MLATLLHPIRLIRSGPSDPIHPVRSDTAGRITFLIRFSIDFGSISNRLWSRFGVAGMPFCIVDNRIWSTWADFKLIWDWIRIWTRFWTGFWAQVGSESECPNQNIRIRILESEYPNQNIRIRMSESEYPNQNMRIRMSESNFDRFWNRFEPRRIDTGSGGNSGRIREEGPCGSHCG